MRRDHLVGRLRARMCRQAYVSVQGWAFFVLALTAGCSVDDKISALPDGPPPIGPGEGGASGSGGIISQPEPRTNDGGLCPQIECSTGATKHCGDFEDACGRPMHCGDCPTGKQCKNNLCVGTNCVSGCSSPAATYCGAIGDGCGGKLDCATVCPKDGWTCGTNHVCQGDPSVCQAATCRAASGDNYCGKIGDGCGHLLDCGDPCPSNWDCVDNLCVGSPTACKAVTCTTDTGGHYCGTIGNGCGGSIVCDADCSAAGTNWVCNANVCVGGPDCVKGSCNNAKGVQQYCGDIGDGCGGTLNCPTTCPSGVACGAVTPNVCEACGNLCLMQVRCDGGAATSISGTVYDPAGYNPLYNVIVSIPNAALDPITTGATCASCDTQVTGKPIATALTDANGHFTLQNVPWGTDFPLVMQLGKWRRQVTIPASMVTRECADNPISETKPVSLLRLPSNIHDGDQNGQYTSIPKIAIAAGDAGSDDGNAKERLQCLLRRIGVDVSEFSLPSGTGSIHMYNQALDSDKCNQIAGSTDTFPDATTNLWDSQAHLNQYDVILLNCGKNPDGGNLGSAAGRAFIPSPAAVDRMKAYVNAGGRVFAEHFHYAWIRSYTNYPSTFGEVATWYDLSKAVTRIGTDSRDTLIDLSFPKVVAFANWLMNVGASTTLGHLALTSMAKYTAIDQINPPSQRWIYEPANPGAATGDAGAGVLDAGAATGAAQYTHFFSFNTPIGAAAADQCGKFVYTALHVSDSASTGFPGDPPASSPTASFGGATDCCSSRTELSAQEKALEFMFFDLSGCVVPVELPPSPPPTPGAMPPGEAPPQAPPPALPPPDIVIIQ